MDFRLPRPPFIPPRPPPPGVRPMPPFANPMNMAPQGRPLLNRPPRSFPRAGPFPPPMFRGPPPPSAPPPPPPPMPPPFAHQRPPLIRTPPARFHQPFGFNRHAIPPFPPVFGDKFPLNGTKPRDFKHNMEAEFNKPWISPDMKDEILKKHKLHQKARKSKNPEVWDEFREQRNKVTSMLREAKLSFQGNSLQSKKEKKFFCDTCDRAYENQEQLDEHLGQHIKCGCDGCQFEAHTKIVDLHIKMQHESGYASKIMQLTSPEEINKWREERKKNFPTLESIQQKKKANSEHKANGETTNKNQSRINIKRKKNNRGRGFKYRMNRSMFPPGMLNRGPFPGRGLGPPFRGKMMAGRGRGRFGMHMPFPHLRPNPSMNNGLRKFAGIANINSDQEMMDSPDNMPTKVALPVAANNKNSFSEIALGMPPNHDPMSYMFAVDVDGDSDDGPVEVKIERKTNTETEEGKPTLGGALGLLMNNYGCDTESENESRKTRNKNRNRKRGRTKSSKIEMDDQEKKYKTCKKTPVMMMRKHQLSLLQKLLAREIQHERNVILQCVQYVVQKNFFGIGK